MTTETTPLDAGTQTADHGCGRPRSFWTNEDGTRGFECGECDTVYDGIAPDEMAGIRAQHVCTVDHDEGDDHDDDSAVDEVAVDPAVVERAEYVAGLRALADALEQHPDTELPYTGRRHAPICVIPHTKNQRTQLAAWARALPGRKDKQARDSYLDLAGTFRGVHVQVICQRDEVCDRIVLGTREVVEMVQDPELLAAVPLVEQTRDEEIVEWRCSAVLSNTTETEAAR